MKHVKVRQNECKRADASNVSFVSFLRWRFDPCLSTYLIPNFRFPMYTLVILLFVLTRRWRCSLVPSTEDTKCQKKTGRIQPCLYYEVCLFFDILANSLGREMTKKINSMYLLIFSRCCLVIEVLRRTVRTILVKGSYSRKQRISIAKGGGGGGWG